MPYAKAIDYLVGGKRPEERSQISDEIDYFLKYYKGIRPAMAISYDRIAMAGTKDPDLRITFDTNIRWRTKDMDLTLGGRGRDILEPGQVLMELKIAGSVPLELSRIFSELKIYQTSFSKYGRGFEILCAEEPQILMPAPLPAACGAEPGKIRERRSFRGLLGWRAPLGSGRPLISSHRQRAAQLH